MRDVRGRFRRIVIALKVNSLKNKTVHHPKQTFGGHTRVRLSELAALDSFSDYSGKERLNSSKLGA
jgi:hypothetical protein